jgi:hypothetical protein
MLIAAIVAGKRHSKSNTKKQHKKGKPFKCDVVYGRGYRNQNQSLLLISVYACVYSYQVSQSLVF